jgi:hypothetical protein
MQIIGHLSRLLLFGKDGHSSKKKSLILQCWNICLLFLRAKPPKFGCELLWRSLDLRIMGEYNQELISTVKIEGLAQAKILNQNSIINWLC